MQPQLLKHVLTCRNVALYGRSRERAAACAADLAALGFRVEICASSDEVAQRSELIVTTTLFKSFAAPLKVTWFPTSEVCVASKPRRGRLPGSGFTVES